MRAASMITFNAGALLLFLLMQSVPQSSDVTQSTLRVYDTISVAGTTSSSLQAPQRCDAEGNVYLQFYQPTNPQSPILRISADGAEKQAFSLASVQDFENAYIDSFTVTPDGAVALAVRRQNPKTKLGEGYVLRFKSDGTFDRDSAIELGSRNPFQVAVFSSGNLLISGTQDTRLYGKGEPAVSVPFTEVINQAGDIVKKLTLPGDFKPPKPSDPGFTAKSGEEPAEITLGDAVSGNDGNIYLTRHSVKPTVYVIASDGSLVRTLKLIPPSPTARQVGGLHYSDVGGGQLAIVYQTFEESAVPKGQGRERPPVRVQTQIVSIYNAQGGERLADYSVSPGIGGTLACYTPAGFTFLGSTPQHQLVLKQAKPY